MPYPRETANTSNRNHFSRTDRDIQDAFTSLIADSSFPSLTIAEICEKAGVSRTTFYQHFSDKYALLERTLISLLIIPESEYALHSSEPFIVKTRSLMKVVAQNCADHRAFLQSILNDSNLPAFVGLFSSTVEEGVNAMLRHIMRSSRITASEDEYLRAFLSSAVFGALMYWIKRENFADIDGFCAAITGYVANTLKIGLE